MKYLGKIQDNKDLVTKEYVDNADSGKVDKVSGKGLSTNDYTTAEKNKLAGIAAGAQVNSVTGVKGNSESSYRTGNVNITAANVGAVAKSGDTMTGALVSVSNKYTADTGGEYGINMSNSDIANVNGIYTSDTAEDGREGYNFYRDATHWDSFHILNGVGYITPNRSRGAAGNKEVIITEKLKGNGTTDYTIRPLVSQTRANRLAFLPPDQVIIEKTTDGGTTWVDAGFSDDAKRKLFSYGGNGVSIPLLNNTRSTQCGLRITITGMKYNVPSGTAETSKYNYWNSNYIVSQERYFNVREWWFWISSQSDRMTCTIQAATGANSTNWVTYHNDNDFRMSGWSGSDWIRCGGGNTFGGGTTQTTNYWNWRLTFFSAYVPGNSAFTGNSAQYIYFIRCYGDSVWGQPNNLMADDHLYRIDEAMNATFPAGVTATKINGAILRNYNNTTANANDITANGFSYYTSNGPATSLGATVNDGALYSQAYSTSWVAQIAQDYRNGGLFVRGKNNGTWQSWQKVYDSAHKPSLSADVTGTLPVANGGTGATTAEGAANNIFSGLPAWTADPTDDTYFPRQDTGGSASYGKVKFSTVWNYIKGKISSVLGLTASQYGGNAATATNASKVNNLTVQTAVPANAVFTDTTYESKAAASGGTAVSLVTTGEKYTWNHKMSSIADVTNMELLTYEGTTNDVMTVGLHDDEATSKIPVVNATTGKIPASVYNNTTYESKEAASGGTAVSLVTTGEKYTWNNKQATLVSGTNIKTINNTSLLGSGNINVGGGGGTTDYSDLSNKPQINSNTLSGNKTSADLGLQSALSVESQTLTVNSTYFSLYSGSPYTTTDATIKLRRYGKVVSISGMVKPKSAIAGSDTEYTICTVPTGYRPTQCIIQVMQGSTQYRWCLKINSGGSVTFSRYAASTSYAQASTSAWLPFHATWIID